MILRMILLFLAAVIWGKAEIFAFWYVWLISQNKMKASNSMGCIGNWTVEYTRFGKCAVFNPDAEQIGNVNLSQKTKNNKICILENGGRKKSIAICGLRLQPVGFKYWMVQFPIRGDNVLFESFRRIRWPIEFSFLATRDCSYAVRSSGYKWWTSF